MNIVYTWWDSCGKKDMSMSICRDMWINTADTCDSHVFSHGIIICFYEWYNLNFRYYKSCNLNLQMAWGTIAYFVKVYVFLERLLIRVKDNTAAAAAAKSLQSCPTLSDPIEGSPPGSPVPGILQARTLEWVAISFSNAWKWKVKVKLLSRVQLFSTPWTAAYQAPPSMGFSRQEYWSGVPHRLSQIPIFPLVLFKISA